MLKIGLRCNFFYVEASLSKKIAEDKKTAVKCQDHTQFFLVPNSTSISIVNIFGSQPLSMLGIAMISRRISAGKLITSSMNEPYGQA